MLTALAFVITAQPALQQVPADKLRAALAIDVLAIDLADYLVRKGVRGRSLSTVHIIDSVSRPITSQGGPSRGGAEERPHSGGPAGLAREIRRGRARCV